MDTDASPSDPRASFATGYTPGWLCPNVWKPTTIQTAFGTAAGRTRPTGRGECSTRSTASTSSARRLPTPDPSALRCRACRARVAPRTPLSVSRARAMNAMPTVVWVPGAGRRQDGEAARWNLLQAGPVLVMTGGGLGTGGVNTPRAKQRHRGRHCQR